MSSGYSSSSLFSSLFFTTSSLSSNNQRLSSILSSVAKTAGNNFLILPLLLSLSISALSKRSSSLIKNLRPYSMASSIITTILLSLIINLIFLSNNPNVYSLNWDQPHISEEILDRFICIRTKGFFPHETRCDHFYECRNGTIINEGICRPGLRFDYRYRKKPRCIPIDQIDCRITQIDYNEYVDQPEPTFIPSIDNLSDINFNNSIINEQPKTTTTTSTTTTTTTTTTTSTTTTPAPPIIPRAQPRNNQITHFRNGAQFPSSGREIFQNENPSSTTTTTNQPRQFSPFLNNIVVGSNIIQRHNNHNGANDNKNGQNGGFPVTFSNNIHHHRLQHSQQFPTSAHHNNHHHHRGITSTSIVNHSSFTTSSPIFKYTNNNQQPQHHSSTPIRSQPQDRRNPFIHHNINNNSIYNHNPFTSARFIIGTTTSTTTPQTPITTTTTTTTTTTSTTTETPETTRRTINNNNLILNDNIDDENLLSKKHKLLKKPIKLRRGRLQDQDEVIEDPSSGLNGQPPRLTEQILSRAIAAPTLNPYENPARARSIHCPSPNGYYPDRNDCRKFYACDDGRAFLMSCPLGLAYDEMTGTCSWPDMVEGCRSEEMLRFNCPEPNENEILDYGDPRYPTSDCRKFVVCIHSEIHASRTPRLLGCEEGLVFNPDTRECDYPENVPVCANYYEAHPFSRSISRSISSRKRKNRF